MKRRKEIQLKVYDSLEKFCFVPVVKEWNICKEKKRIKTGTD
ncbi:MAG TPA: hypothetical protein VLB50_00770 [Ignavibacteriaceae bacterium]|nr:hypothetical protein [Ignavibacteriaceae bacterium]